MTALARRTHQLQAIMASDQGGVLGRFYGSRSVVPPYSTERPARHGGLVFRPRPNRWSATEQMNRLSHD